MLLSDISVKRPVFATVINLLLITFGAVAFTMLPLREYPDIDPPIVSISTEYPGASSEIIESKITQVLEDRISGVEGIKNITSSSRNGRSQITVEFELSRDIDAAANDLRERISRAVGNLPDQALPPEVFKSDSDEDVIAWFVMNSETMSTLELTDYAERYIVDRFSVVDGVARIRVGGGFNYAMKVWLDRKAMAARGVTAEDIENVLRSENVELPAGDIKSLDRDFSVRVERSFRTETDFKNIAVTKGNDGYLVRLGEVADIELTAEDEDTEFRGNGKNMVGIGIIKQSKANTLEVVRNAREELEQIKQTLPEGTTIERSYDSSIFIAESIKEVYQTLLIAMIMVVIVIYLFLGNIRATLIPAVTVPVALVASVSVLYALGFSINLLTLLALVLAIGLVVDDSIVVLENIYRRIEQGENPLLASYRGAREVGFAVIATTLVLVSVFVPLIFLEGDIGRLFTEFALTVAAAVSFSSITALSLSPMLCSKILKKRERNSKFGQWLDNGFASLERFYANSLTNNLTAAKTAFVLILVSIACIYGLMQKIPGELAPKEDRGNFFVLMNVEQGASFKSNAANMKKVEERLLTYVDTGEFDRVIVRVPGFGGNGGIAIIGMDDWQNRTRSTWEVMNEVSQKLSDLTDIRAFAIMRRGIGGRGLGRPIQFVIQGNTWDELSAWRDVIIEKAGEHPAFIRIDHDYKETLPQFLVQINKERAADLGVSVSAIGRTLETMLGQRRATTFLERGEEYNVILEGRDELFSSPTDINNIYVRSATTDALIPLDNLVSISEQATAASLNRYNRIRSITITANLADGYALSDALDVLNNIVQTEIDGNIAIDYKGQSQTYVETGNSIIFIFILALAVTFLVLAAQFESFVHPLVIMLAVPLGLVGALSGLYFSGMTLNIYSQIGLVMLIGLAAKNGILIVEFTNQLRDQGEEFKTAIVQAATQRLRPIIMTAFTTVMSAVPLVIAVGPGSESRAVIGMVILAGVSVATLLTIYIVPAMYYAIARNTGSPLQLSQELDKLEQREKQAAAKS